MGLASPPTKDAFVMPEDPRLGKQLPKLVITLNWLKYLGDLVLQVDKTAARALPPVVLTGIAGAIPTTPFAIGNLAPGLYRISYWARVTQPGTVSSTFQITFGWTDGAVALTSSGAAEAGNLTTTKQFGTLVIRIDRNTPITYATAYGSVGATPMQHRLDMVVEALGLATI